MPPGDRQAVLSVLRWHDLISIDDAARWFVTERGQRFLDWLLSFGGPAAFAPARITAGSVPDDGKFGLFVFGGGTIAQLVTAAAAGRDGRRLAIWATVNGRFVTYLPGTRIGQVNAEFLAAFPNGNIPANTAFIGTMRP